MSLTGNDLMIALGMRAYSSGRRGVLSRAQKLRSVESESFTELEQGMAQPILTAKEMQALDRWAIVDEGVPSLTLMESAGRAIANSVASFYPKAHRVLAMVGKGNNGGDGLVVARLLREEGLDARVWMIAPEEEISGDAEVNLHRARKSGVPILIPDRELPSMEEELAAADLVIDAVFGTGLRGAPRGGTEAAIGAIRRSGRPVLAVDGPSGVEGDTGRAEGEYLRADRTVALAHLKVGHLLHPGRSLAGEIEVADIGIPTRGAPGFPRRYRIEEGDLRKRWPGRPANCHKGSVGRLLVLAGSRGMLGAACLAAEAAMRTGAGYVVLAAPTGMIDILAGKLLEVVLRPLPQTEDGVLGAQAAPEAVELARRADAVAIGPGLGAAESFLRAFFDERPAMPCVIDADGLRAVDRVSLRADFDVLTPHAGELGRILGKTREEIEDDLLGAANEARERVGATVLLKGSPTLVCGPTGDLFFSDTGNPAMATAGCGDVLTGVIGALLAAGVESTDAAWMGAWLHGRAGDRAALRLGNGLLARDVRDEIPAAMREIAGEIGGR